MVPIISFTLAKLVSRVGFGCYCNYTTPVVYVTNDDGVYKRGDLVNIEDINKNEGFYLCAADVCYVADWIRHEFSVNILINSNESGFTFSLQYACYIDNDYAYYKDKIIYADYCVCMEMAIIHVISDYLVMINDSDD